jgi:RNA polymerase sigma-70 factor, ECF subfamily
MEQFTDDELLKLVKGGNGSAFDSIVDRYYKGLFNFLLRMLSNREDAEDALHDTFIKAASGLEKYRMEGKFKSWLYAIAGNSALSKIRERKRRKILSAFRRDSGDESANPVDLIPDESLAPAKGAEQRELSSLLESAVSSLPLLQKQVFLMRHASGLSFREISEALNIPVNTALGRMHYAVLKIRSSLGEKFLNAK